MFLCLLCRKMEKDYVRKNSFCIEDALNLYKEIKEKYPNYLEQFFETTAKILNLNYVKPISEVETDDLPF